jgi:hypothetical protein
MPHFKTAPQRQIPRRRLGKDNSQPRVFRLKRERLVALYLKLEQSPRPQLPPYFPHVTFDNFAAGNMLKYD